MTTVGKRRTRFKTGCFKRRNPANEIIRPIPQEPEDEDRFYVIEELLEKRSDDDGKEEYLVRWQNYPPEYDTWEPIEELQRNCQDMIDHFNRVEGSSKDDGSHCICKSPYRFKNGGLIQCYNCVTWYHFKCLKMNMEEANSFLRYYCPVCRDKNPSLQNIVKCRYKW